VDGGGARLPTSELDALTRQLTAQLLQGSRSAQLFSKRLAGLACSADLEAVTAAYLDYQSRTLRSPEHQMAMEQYRQRKP
jgi:hypothetical protein